MSRSFGREVHHVLAADGQGAAADLLEPRDHPQCRRLPASRRADEDQELAVVDRQAEILDRLIACPIGLADLVQHDLGHYRLSPSRRRSIGAELGRARLGHAGDAGVAVPAAPCARPGPSPRSPAAAVA